MQYFKAIILQLKINKNLKVLKQNEETERTKNKASQLVRIEGNAVFPGSVGFL